MDCVFCKIRDRIITKEFTYEDEDIMVFPDIHPLKPIHLLIVPKIHTEDYLDFNDQELITKIKKVINKMIEEQKLDNRGYRVSINGGGAQLVGHTHFHLMGPISVND
ncbi:MAG TPA: HIT domain-containing protein [Patescibacteria group bacterium]|jgi:histidine triad (HIT) family protein|nr:HIT domain-containing protein [Patescibacteria group bacterium]